MRSLLAVALGLIVGLPFTVAAPGKDKEDKDDLKKFEGDWKITSWRQYGRDLEAEALDTAKWTVKGDKYTFEMGGNQEEGKLKIDAAKKPMVCDLEITEGNDKGKGQPGIYKIDGDTLTVCFAAPGAKDRPKDFTSTEDDMQILVVMKRKKKED
jgi:uncharacterized protein (TIGR03067 family)